MNLLLDTHAFLWFLADDPKLSANVLSGRRQISKENVTRLAKHFHVDLSVFMPEG